MIDIEHQGDSMAKNDTIVCIHGINTRTDDPATLERAWEDAIIESSGVKVPREKIFFVYWGGLAEEYEKKHCLVGDTKSKKAMLKFQENVIVDAMGSGRNGVTKIQKKNWTASVSTREDALGLFEAMDLPLRKALHDLAHDAYLYFYVSPFAEAVRNLLSNVIAANQEANILLMGHSLGSVICYDVLRASEDTLGINDLITFGSPLGLGFVQPKLRQASRRRFPKGICRSWTNISDPIDFVATDHELADNFKRERKKAIIDLSVRNTAVDDLGNREPHSSLGYIRAEGFGAVLRNLL